MKKFTFFLTFTAVLIASCFGFKQTSLKSSSDSKNIFSSQLKDANAKFQALYIRKVMPMFTANFKAAIPNKVETHTGNGLGNKVVPGLIFVYHGMINLNKDSLRIFALSHELAHIVILEQAVRFGLPDKIPSDYNMNDSIRSEFLADLIALHIIAKSDNLLYQEIIRDFPFLQNSLGFGDDIRPSGRRRINLLRRYVSDSIVINNDNAFRNIFFEVWNGNKNI